jgi:tungstate transport system ATP-binding protein
VLLLVVGAIQTLIGLLQWPAAATVADPGPAPHQEAPPLPHRATPRPEPRPLVELQGATVQLGRVLALRDITLTLCRGDRLALVGANGSGKTTLLRLLHGLLQAPAGCKRHLLQPEGRAPVAAMLFQRPFLLNLSVRQNVLLALWLRRVPADQREQRCRTALQRVGLDGLAARPARVLSGGQQQRLALARAWALQPDILFLDEATASLDPGAKREIENLIDAVADNGITLVMSTHNLGQAKRLARRVVYLEAGRLIVDLPVERFFTDTLPSEAALFLKGESPWV